MEMLNDAKEYFGFRNACTLMKGFFSIQLRVLQKLRLLKIIDKWHSLNNLSIVWTNCLFEFVFSFLFLLLFLFFRGGWVGDYHHKKFLTSYFVILFLYMMALFL